LLENLLSLLIALLWFCGFFFENKK